MASPFEPVESQSHVEKVNASYLSYQVEVGGSLDMDNSMTILFGSVKIAFQNNESLTIANTGDVIVRNPRVVANNQRRWWSMESLLEEILQGAETDQEKAYRIYDFVRKNRYHDFYVFTGDELHDPVKFMNEFGGGFCDDSGFVGCSLFYHAGLNKTKLEQDPRVRTLKGHMMCEAYVDGDFQFLDIDQQTFYLDLENEKPVSGNAVVKDHYLAKREQAYGPQFTSWSIGEKAAALFGQDDGSMFRAVAGHRIDFDLRPGERIVYRWDNVGKFPSDDSQSKLTRSFWGNSLWVYEPRLNEARIQENYVEVDADHHIYRMTTPYAVSGGRIQAVFEGKSSGDTPTIYISLDRMNWKQVWRGAGTGTDTCTVNIDDHLEYKRNPPKYTYYVKVAASPDRIRDLRIETDLMISPLSLPRLRTGRNEIVYSDQTTGPHEVTITHRWRESSSVEPPVPPIEPGFPANGSIVRSTTIPFSWAEESNADLYQLQVSRHQDMRFAFRPSFDVYVDVSEHHSPFAGLFSPGEEYFWRVKVRDATGIWGRWSPVWSFFWEGPRIPVDVRADFGEGEITLHWQPNPRGPHPTSYEVYGSDEKGFTPSKSSYEVQGLGPQPANLLARISGESILVVKAGADHQAMNRSFYRVVAIDENGVASGPSRLLELPHPFVYSQPDTVTKAGQPYTYEVRTLTSLGDLQQRYVEPGADFWEREGYEFELLEGPEWLIMDKESGVLSGNPSIEDRGVFPVTILVRRTYPFEQAPDGHNAQYFQKDHELFQAEYRQVFQLKVK